MPVPPDELHKYYYELGSYHPKSIQRIDDIEDGNFNILKWWNGEVESPADLDGYKLVLSRGKPAALFDHPILLVSTPVGRSSAGSCPPPTLTRQTCRGVCPTRRPTTR